MPVAVVLSLRRLTGASRSHHEPGMTWGAQVSEEIRRTVGSCAMEELDRQIVQLLVKDGRMSYTDLGKATGLSTSAVHQRVRRLEERGLILGYGATIDHAAAGKPLTAFVSVTPFDVTEPDDYPKRLQGIQEIESCWSVAGE